MSEHVFANLKWLRQALGMIEGGPSVSQRDLAERLGVTAVSVANWEYKSAPSATMVERLATYFADALHMPLSPDDLLTRDLASDGLPLLMVAAARSMGTGGARRAARIGVIGKGAGLSAEQVELLNDLVTSLAKSPKRRPKVDR